jgi:hypothetical protein
MALWMTWLNPIGVQESSSGATAWVTRALPTYREASAVEDRRAAAAQAKER